MRHLICELYLWHTPRRITQTSTQDIGTLIDFTPFYP